MRPLGPTRWVLINPSIHVTLPHFGSLFAAFGMKRTLLTHTWFLKGFQACECLDWGLTRTLISLQNTNIHLNKYDWKPQQDGGGGVIFNCTLRIIPCYDVNLVLNPPCCLYRTFTWISRHVCSQSKRFYSDGLSDGLNIELVAFPTVLIVQSRQLNSGNNIFLSIHMLSWEIASYTDISTTSFGLFVPVDNLETRITLGWAVWWPHHLFDRKTITVTCATANYECSRC